LDYDGTLVPFDLHHEHTKPDSSIKEILYQLGTDPKNHVILISGRDKDHLEAHWWSIPITLVAEHGGYYRKHGEAWREVFSFSTDWIPKTLPALNALAFQYEGTFVEQKNYSIAWHYRAIKDKITETNKRQILAAIRSLPEKEHFGIYDGEFTIELRTFGVDKGSFISHWSGNK
jgi:trehalose 6-phosphate synthase/phosphatase